MSLPPELPEDLETPDAAQAPEGDALEPVDRRTFLRMGAAAAASIAVGCADDGAGLEAGSEDESAGSESAGLDEIGTSESDTGSDEAESDAETGTDSETETDTGEPLEQCEGELIDFDPEAVALDELGFPLALMAGEMRPDSVMLAVYIEDAAPRLLRVWRPSDQPGVIDLIAEREVVPDADGYAKLGVDGLCSGTWYRYAYFSDEDGELTARSRVAEFRTAIAEDSLEPVVVAISACNGNSFDWPALERTAEEYYDVFCHLGDMAYNDGAFTRDEYRAKWKQYLGNEGFKSVYALAGLYATWDDHEITDNSAFDPETEDPAQLEKKDNALNAYFEVLPIAQAEAEDYKLWRSFRWGLSVEFFVLDCRYERRPSLGEYISQAQMDWLEQGLMASPCHFKVILNSVPITNMPILWDVAADDRWEGFPGARDSLLAFIDDHQIENVWFIAGDFHVCFVSRLEPMGTTLSARTREIAVTGGRTNFAGDTLGLSTQFDYGVGDPRGCVLTFDPALDAVNVRFINPEGGDDYNQDLTQD
ncbi:alkaline phosphatase D family protein [Pseudenhygromyxa sp. WMMC2535]|uniref:alkaline phosphatase D family protein n=1 Tax=Pseudenhygromyxa sp. WMMC2535 TaxID=2712867 RepID=UPI0015528FF1|nr:alkaline phosphatase D family protein [Pseudenhygromyxa sp. WMMC2535]NVB40078.1 alkaline phosphatase D family protein [Pseudenhygromyxa sp. WMMC2535]